jgi:hypothetical protein
MADEEDAGIAEAKNTRFSNYSMGTREGTVYFDADDGLDAEEERKIINEAIKTQIGPKLGSTKTIIDIHPRVSAIKEQPPVESKLISKEKVVKSPQSAETQGSNYGVQSRYNSSS